MATRIRTLDFLPEIFRTPTNAQFLSATLDQLIAQPSTEKIQGYVGSKFGYGVNPNDYYVAEPTKTRTDYQLDPGVVFLKPDTATANDFISYPAFMDALRLKGGLTENNSRLFTSQFYSWDSFTDLDKIINFNQYYWLPVGPERVIVSNNLVYNFVNYNVTSDTDAYVITSDISSTSAINPTLTLLRGGTYTFTVDQTSQFWIQGEPGTTGYSRTQPNVQTRNVYGVTNNGAEQGVVTFTVPYKNALDQYVFPGNNTVDVVSTLTYDQVNGASLLSIGGIDGVTSLDGLTMLFYGAGDSATYYTISLIGEGANPTIQLTAGPLIPTEQNIRVNFGTEWIGRNFFRNIAGVTELIPYNSAILDTLYYQDGTTSDKVGVIRLVDSNYTSDINVVTQILGKKNYTSPNGVVFTNGLKVLFQGNIYPESFNNIEYYVEGVGTGIELLPVTSLVSPGLFSAAEYTPYDTTPYDIGNYDSNLYVPIDPDYITIARNSINKNAWSRSNRWFHIDVINATAAYNDSPELIAEYTTYDNKAKRPIIEFYPNLELFNSGTIGKNPIDFIDTKTTNAFLEVEGKYSYYPDTAGYTNSTAAIAPVTGSISKLATSSSAQVNQVLLNNITGINVNDTVTFGVYTAGSLVAGETYTIVSLGNTDFTLIGAPINDVGVTFIATGAGAGTGTASGDSFGNIVSGATYYITSINSLNNGITIATSRQGTTVTLLDGSGSISAEVYPYSTTIIIPTSDVFGLFQVNQYITDSDGILPQPTQISSITTQSTNTIITVYWYGQSVVPATTNVSVVSADTPLDNYSIFDGARVVFAVDENVNIRNKIYVAQFSTISEGSTPIVTLSEASDGLVLPQEQMVINRGYNYLGKDFYYDGVNWVEAQQKLTTNQAPKFDIFDKNGISLGDKAIYSGSSFAGCTLFQYGIGTGSDDSVLGFPLRYSSVANLGDISFDVTLNSQTFNYVDGTTPITENVNTGYVYNYTLPKVTFDLAEPLSFDRLGRVRQTGWETAVSPSIQYQIFEFPWTYLDVITSFTCDIAPNSSSSTNWPVVQVYIDNQCLPTSAYSMVTTGTSTTVTIPDLSLTRATELVIQILIYSDQISPTAYYQVPVNLSNNPFNTSLTTANIGEIRSQYQSIFYNNPHTVGQVFGKNNYRDLGNLVPWGNTIIQNSASLVLPGTFLRKQEHNLFDALIYNSRQYINFKNLLVYTVNNTSFTAMQTPAEMLDVVMVQLTTGKTDTESFFWSDMLPAKAPYISNTYTFPNSLDVSTYSLSRIYDYSVSNYYGVLVYLTRSNMITQLISGVDYTISSTSPSLTITTDLLPNDQITINEYYQTYGNYVPNTPTKLGLYPSSIPAVVLDPDYTIPTYFILGHDGSFNKLYGDYNPVTGKLVDFRDQVLLEYEKRVYNNLKLSNTIPVELYEILPGFFRTTDYSYDEFLQIYSESFLNWVGENRIDYQRQIYNKNNQFTFNYRDSGNKINREAIEQGYFRGLYLYYYDTSTPDTTPWQMIGYTDQPSWWNSRYGAAPYTSNNLVLWGDLAEGIDWNDGNPIVIPKYVRNGLLNVIPVDSNGNLVSPLISIVGNYDQFMFNRDWIVGDVGPAEFSYRRSSSWPFDLMRILALTKPADFFNLGVDVDIYKYNIEFNQYLVNDRTHLVPSDIKVYGSGTPVTSYINWIVDYEKQVGIDATTNITSLINNLDVRLIYRMAGFSDKTFLSFYVEKSSANANNSALLIPNESYGLLLYQNQPFDRIVYSGVVVQVTKDGYKVFGNSQTNAYFKVLIPKATVVMETITVQDKSVIIANDFYTETKIIPYGTEFYNVQQVAEFLNSYGAYLTSQGMLFETIENGIQVTWKQMINEFLYWSQMGWGIGSITTINPAASTLVINKDSYIVQPLTLQQFNFILNQNLYPIQNVDLSIIRDETAFTASPLNSGDAISYGQFNISNMEHAVVFDNTTLFNDTIYNLVTGLRQNRIYLRGTKTAEWNGTLSPSGFILNQDNILDWNTELKYTKGTIVKYKNKYWSALQIVQASQVFDQLDWKEVPYAEIQKGLLLNSQTRSYESTLYYDVNRQSLENDADVLSFSLIGYRPRDYLAVADLTEITQVNVYKNMIKEKGTLKALTAFKGATLPQGGIDYDIYENWAILAGEFNGVLNNNFIQFRLKQADLTSNPFIVSLTDGVGTVGSQQEVPTYSVYNYGRPITSANILPIISLTTPSSLYPTAGYVNFNDVKMASYYYSGLATAQNAAGTVIPISEFYIRDYVWLANYLGTWNVYTPTSLGTVVYAKNNINGTVTITFSAAHNLKRFDMFAIVNFDPAINNYYIVSAVVDPFSLIINLSLDPQITTVTGQGIGFRMQTQRVATAPEIGNLSSLIANEFNKLKVWVDTNNDGSWAVYRKSLNYQYTADITKLATGSFGAAVAHTSNLGYLISDPDNSIVYRYRYNGIDNTYYADQTLTQGSSFGSFISYADDFFVISEPTVGLNVYIYQLISTILVDEIVLYQTIESPDVAITEWGVSTAISGDKNWLYISATLELENTSVVYAYRYNSQTEVYEFGTILDIGSVASDNFGYSIATDYYGDTVAIGAPGTNYDIDTSAYGYTFIFSRTVQSFVAASTSQSYIPLVFPLSWTPSTITQIATNTTAGTNLITVASTSGFAAGDTVVFTGTLLSSGALSNNVVYYILPGFTSTKFQISLTIGGDPVSLTTDSGSMSVVVQSDKLSVTVNGLLLASNNYAVVGTELYFYSGTTPILNAGDLIEVSGGNFVLAQTLDNGQTPRVGTEFGYSVETNNFANEILVGAPFELSEQNYEGAVHRFTNGGEKYGMIIGTQECNITSPRIILLNGFIVSLPIGDATSAASAINASYIINVQASASNGKLLIALIDTTISIPNKKLSLTVLNPDTLGMMGITLYTQTQKIMCPHLPGATQFGTNIKLDDVSGSIVVSAPVGTRYVATTFDFTDDELDNDTIFDNNATQWVDTFTNAGAVYMFDYLSVYNESLNEPGKYVYAQSTNAENIDYGSQPLYGKALDFNNNNVVIGAPNFNPSGNFNVDVGQVVIYISSSVTPDWTVYRSSSNIVDISGVFNTQLFSANTNQTLDNLDYLDPLQGKLLGAVTENIDVVSNIDPACYNSSTDTQRGLVWGAEKLGQLWFNTSATRFLNYHQNDVVYNSQYWGRVFPGSDVAVYSWITSNVTPAGYTGPGTPYSFENYVTHGVINAEGLVVPIYYFWVRNTNIVFEQLGKTLSDSTLEFYITNPQASGISYFAPLLPNTFAVYNGSEYLNGIDTVINIGYATSTNDNALNTQYNLIRANFADDFLPGVPGSGAAFQYHSALGITQPVGLYNRMLDSMCGVDNAGAVIPDPFLPPTVRTGVLARPRQGFFLNRFGALENYLQYANTVLAQFPIIELRNPTFLYNTGDTVDTKAYWTPINWWATGYNDNTKSSLQVPLYADLATLNVATGTIVTVSANGAGSSETYIYTVAGTWVRIGLENGTIKFSSYLWDYASARLGFGDNFFDTDLYDLYPSTETRNIVRALNEQIYTDELLIFRNKSLILLFEYIQSETIESQNYLVWLNKTSLVDISHTIRELIPLEVFRSDNQVFLEGYINEAKPYHVVIKDFLFKYTRTDIFEGDITDFDLPAKYNTAVNQFISPALVYSDPALDNEYLYTDAIWQDPAYSQWYENYGLSIVGEKEFPIALLESYLALNTTVCYINNASGFPVTGTILIGTELIGYSGVDVANNQLYGLSRGADNTTPAIHIPGEPVLIDLPGVLLLDGGRAYTQPPIITAYIDTSIYPAPRIAAKLQPVMSLDKMIGVTVLDPGEGYAVLPEIIIDPAFTLDVSSSQIEVQNNLIQLIEPVLLTGDLIQYNVPSGSTKILGLINGQRYYVNVISSDPVVLFALYPSYSDAINDHNRVVFGDTGTGTQQFSLGGYATCISSSAPIRENIVTLRFDRTSYTSNITDWTSGSFYGAKILPDITTISSSSITLESSQPAIDTVLASGGGIAFDILDVNNQQTLAWSSRTRDTIQTYGSLSAYPNTIRINPSTGGANVNLEIGSTVGFYIGMPVKFQGSVVGGLVYAQTYYVKSLVQLPNLTTSVLEDTGFTISATIDDNGVPGATYTLTTASVPLAGLTLFTGETTNLAELTINYDDLRTATSTTSGSNSITVQLTPTGQAGTTKLYTGLPVFFTVTTPETVIATAVIIGQTYVIASLGTTDFRLIGASKNVLGVVFTATAVGTGTGTASLTTFGGITANEIYYVTSVIDNYAFTVSTVSNPTTFNVTATTASIVLTAGFFVIGNTYIITTLGNTDFTDFGASVNQVGVSFVATNVGGGTGTATQAATITCETTTLLSVNEPIMFTGDVFGGIVAGQLYYVSVIYNGGLTFAVSTSIGGASVALTTDSGSCTLTSQADGVQLTTTTGSMTLNVGLSPISPGQINGQLLTFYPTSPIDIIGVYGPISNLIERTISSTLSTVNRICLSSNSGGITNVYTGMKFNIASNIGGLTTSGGPYTITDTGTTTVTVESTESSGNWLVLPVSSNPDTTKVLYEGMPIVFTGASFGGISVNTLYYVLAIDTSPPAGEGRFTITKNFIDAVTVNTFTGSLTGTGETYIEVAQTLTTQYGPVTLTQYHNPAVHATFDVGYILGGYIVNISAPASGYAVTNKIVIPGTDLGGITTLNDMTLTVDTVDTIGGITSVIVSGITPGLNEKYYVKVLTSTTVGLYQDPQLQIPLSGLNFPYNPITTTTATSASSSNNRITVSSSTSFAVNDPVIFTGNIYGGGGFGNIVLGERYYILTKPTSTTVTISETIGGSTFILANGSGTMTMARTGDYALLPEPFYFTPSIVKFNNTLYQCIISNNDPDFEFGKWVPLFSRDRQLNALDRIVGYYAPTVNMPGLDLTQLVSGITYPKSTYQGNAFAPADQYTLDVVLTDKPFYPTNVDVQAIVWDGTKYVATIEVNQEYSAVATSTNAIDWLITRISNSPIEVTDIHYNNGLYQLVTYNNATPILHSTNGLTWTNSENLYSPMNSLEYGNGIYVAAGTSIVSSTDGITWTERYAFTNGYNNVFNYVSYVSAGFTGFMAVGLGQRLVGSNLVNVPLIYTSTNGTTWTQVVFTGTTLGFNAVASNNYTIVTVGEDGVLWTTFNSTTWFVQNSTVAYTLNDIIWANNLFVAVGNNGTIITGTSDGITWTQRTSTVTENLTHLVWNSDSSLYVVVGDNNTVLTSPDAIVWTLSSFFESSPAPYTIEGDTFVYGYGPEELVPGVVLDTMTMVVTTRPGTNWEESIYQHVGYNATSLELQPVNNSQTDYSFLDAVQIPSQLTVSIIDYTTGLGTTIYDGIDYTVDWVHSIVTLTTPLYFVTAGVSDTLRIDVYEVGNGYQLIKSNTLNDPLRTNADTGFQEIFVDANYTGYITQGSGLIRPLAATTIATETFASDNTVLCDKANDFILNGAVKFFGIVFGNIVEGQTYFVKSITIGSGKITLSESLPNGIAGPVFMLSNDSGSMEASIQVGTGATWATPAMFYNGDSLVLGTTATVTQTISATNTVATNSDSTGVMVINSPVVFSDSMFGGVIVPHQVYYIKSILNSSEFTISTTLGGPVLSLTDANGSATIITNDYAFGIADNGVTGKIIYATEYDTSVDYLAYSLFGETTPQYGYTIPQTQLFTGDGSTTFNLINYTDSITAINAIVEIDGLRLLDTAYNISVNTNTITFVSAPANGSTISVVTYNTTDRQYFNTQYGITGIETYSISNIDNNITPSITTVIVSGTTSGTNYVTCLGTSSLIAGQSITFQAANSVAGDFVIGYQYEISFVGNTNFVALGASSNTVGVIFTATGTGTLGQTGTAFLANLGNISLLGPIYYIRSIVNLTQFTLQDQNGNIIVLANATNNIVGTMGGLEATSVTTAIPNNFVLNDLVRINGVNGSTQLNGNTYYVRVATATTLMLYYEPYDPRYGAINYPVTNIDTYISGGAILLADAIQIDSVYQQISPDRLWVTINGYRVPSSSLKIDANNYLSILVPVSNTDKVTITSMMPTATPNQLTYLLNVTLHGEPSVYRANDYTRTWLVEPLNYSDSVIYLNDTTHVTDYRIQESVTPAPVDGVYNVGLYANKNDIVKVIIYNNSSSTTVDPNNYNLAIVGTGPSLEIYDQVSTGDNLTITVIQGGLVIINGEQIKFEDCDIAANTLSRLTRGVNGTSERALIPKYTEVYGIISTNRMSDINYEKTWNPIPGIYNPVLGDPLQIADTEAAIFLRTNKN
jgi:hypothetical protein